MDVILIFDIILVVFGLLNDFVLEMSAYNVVETLLLLGAFLWFQGELRKARTDFV